MTAKIRTLIVDDSVFYRGILTDLLNKTGGVELLGSAANGEHALAKIKQYQPDLVTLDVEMPGMDGVSVLREIRRLFPQMLVVMISSATKSSAKVTIEALEEGALDFIEKPDAGNPDENERLLYRQLRRIISIVETKILLKSARNPQAAVTLPSRSPAVSELHKIDILAIGVSTGGPGALPRVLEKLPVNLGIPVIIVQHMPAMFVSVLVETLGRKSPLPVVEARSNMALEAGKVYLAPGGKQAKVVRAPVSGESVILLTDDPPENFCRPSVDYMFRSLAFVYGASVLAVIMTGMGRDGVSGMELLKAAGASCFAQDRESSVVFGMAMEACKAGVVDEVLPLAELGEAIMRRIRV